jgi:hypothetical protein
MSKKPPQIRGAWLLNPQADGRDIRLDTAAWLSWLEAPATTSFAYPLHDRQQGCIVGLMTVRKDRRQRGGSYWSVFRRSGQRLRRVYLGASLQVTAAHLERIAQQLLAEARPSANA